MKLLYLNLDPGIPVLGDKGASVHVREFVTAAARLGHEVVLACSTLGAGNEPPPARIVELPGPAEAFLEAECAAHGLPAAVLADETTRREIRRLAHDRTLPARLAETLAGSGFRPDLIYERHALFHRAGAALASQRDLPRILEVNAPLVDEQRRFRGLRLERLARDIEAQSYRAATRIVAVSEAVAEHARAVAGAGRPVEVVPNGVDLGRFGDGSGRTAIRRRLRFEGTQVIGFFGSFKAWHGARFLLDVFCDLARARPALRLLAVGDGPEREALRVAAAGSGLADRIVLPGRIPHAGIPDWLAAADLTVAPYLPQPDFYFSPLKVVESLAAGRPVVAPRLGQLADLVDDGETGLLYAPGDAAACRAALLTLLDDPPRLRAMGAQARRRAAAHGWMQAASRALGSVSATLNEENTA